MNSQAEQQALAPKIPSSQSIWMGLHRDPKDTSRWLWVDGTRATYTNWSPGEPNNHQGTFEGCGELWPKSRSRKWNDEQCSATRHYVCETTGRSEKKSYIINNF